MKKNLIAIIAAIFISVPSLFAFHDLATDHLVPGMPVVFIATGPKFPPAMHDAVRTALGRWSSSDCFMSLQNSIDAAVDACLLYTSPSPRDRSVSRMPSSA